MLDRVIRIEPGREGVGLKAVSAADCPMPEGVPTAPALPGPLVLHGLSALAEMVLEEADSRRPVLEAAAEVTFLKTARPGQVLTYTVAVEETSQDGVGLRAEATIEGETAVRARLRYRWVEAAADRFTAGWRGLRRQVLSGEPPPLLR
ncbi:MAG: hypothetical protein ACE5KY_00175 [Candidatus Tectimicrobiota bacterium]